MNDQTTGLETAPAAPLISELPTVAPETIAPVANLVEEDHQEPNVALQAARNEALDHELPAGPEPVAEAAPVVEVVEQPQPEVAIEEELPVQETEPTAAEYSEQALAAHKDLMDMHSNDPGFVDQLIKVNELFIRAGFKKRDEEQAVEPAVESAPVSEPAQTIAEVAPQASQISSLRLPATETTPAPVPAAETVAAAVEEHLAEEQPATQEVAPAA